jgi:hypothetical protein
MIPDGAATESRTVSPLVVVAVLALQWRNFRPKFVNRVRCVTNPRAAAGSVCRSFRLHRSNVFTFRCSDMLVAEIAAPGTVYETALEARIAIGEVAGAGYECSPRTRAVLCWRLLPHSQRPHFGCDTFHGSCSRIVATWFLVRSTSTHTRYTASFMHGRDGVETGWIPSGLQPASVKCESVAAG